MSFDLVFKVKIQTAGICLILTFCASPKSIVSKNNGNYPSGGAPSCVFAYASKVYNTHPCPSLSGVFSITHRSVHLPTSYSTSEICKMPLSKPKPSEIAAQAKKTYIPYIRDNFSGTWPPTSYLCHSESLIATPTGQTTSHCRFGMSQERNLP